jgi:hypothetical protein
MEYSTHSFFSPLLFVFVGAAGWPLLAFILCRYQFRFGRQWILRWTILLFGLAGVAAIGLGDNMVSQEHARQSSAPLFLVRGIVFAFPYVVVAVWLTIRSIRKFRRERSTQTI